MRVPAQEWGTCTMDIHTMEGGGEDYFTAAQKAQNVSLNEDNGLQKSTSYDLILAKPRRRNYIKMFTVAISMRENYG